MCLSERGASGSSERGAWDLGERPFAWGSLCRCLQTPLLAIAGNGPGRRLPAPRGDLVRACHQSRRPAVLRPLIGAQASPLRLLRHWLTPPPPGADIAGSLTPRSRSSPTQQRSSRATRRLSTARSSARPPQWCAAPPALLGSAFAHERGLAPDCDLTSAVSRAGADGPRTSSQRGPRVRALPLPHTAGVCSRGAEGVSASGFRPSGLRNLPPPSLCGECVRFFWLLRCARWE